MLLADYIQYKSVSLFHLEDLETKPVCWRIDQRGAVGETILHVCLLLATSVHLDLAKHLLKCFPDMIHDIYMGDEYYGKTLQSSLHKLGVMVLHSAYL